MVKNEGVQHQQKTGNAPKYPYRSVDRYIDDGYKYTGLVNHFKPNGYDLYDIIGNVWEWCQDWYDNGEDIKVLRGGSWINITEGVRVSTKKANGPDFQSYIFGFRCVVSASDQT